MTIPEDYRLGKLIRDMPVGMSLQRVLGSRWVATYRARSGPDNYTRGFGDTPEEALRVCVVGEEPISRDLWLEEAEHD